MPPRPPRRLAIERLESRRYLCASCGPRVWHNADLPEDVDADGTVAALDALRIVDDLNLRGARPLARGEGEGSAVGEASPALFLDVSDDEVVSALDVLHVVNYLNQAPPAPAALGGFELTAAEVERLLERGAAASASEDAIIAIVDRRGEILGVRVEQGVLDAYTSPAPALDIDRLVFAIDGAVAKARTAAFFANGDGEGGAAPLTSRTVRFISQSTMTQRSVESNPNVADEASTERGPGFVAPIGVGGHFPPGVAHTPPVDLFAIEHTNRDSLLHPGLDGIKGTLDDLLLPSRFNVDPADIPPGQEMSPPESYGVVSGLRPLAQSRGIATLPGGIPLYRQVSGSGPVLVGGIGVFFPGPEGYATHEQGFVPGVGQTELARVNAPKVLEAEWIAFAAAGGSSGAPCSASVGALGGVAALPDFDLPCGRIDLVGITLEIYGPHPTTDRPRSGVQTLLATGAAVGLGDAGSGADQVVLPGVLHRDGGRPPEGWLVEPHGSADLTAADVRRIIEQALAEANRVRAQIRLPKGERTRMVFAVTDTEGEVLGLYRMPDATVFSIDVSVAKARNVAYYADATAIVAEDRIDDNGDGLPDAGVPAGTALTNRTVRFLAEPRFPAGVDGSLPGAFSILRDAGIDPATGENLGPALPASAYSTADTSVLGFDAFHPGRNFRDPDDIAHQNGIVFFPGSTPLYREGKLVGGFGVSGDGVDQDDVVTFFGSLGFHAPGPLRADQVVVRDVRLPYQKFPRNARA